MSSLEIKMSSTFPNHLAQEGRLESLNVTNLNPGARILISQSVKGFLPQKIFTCELSITLDQFLLCEKRRECRREREQCCRIQHPAFEGQYYFPDFIN